jgi:hypothetical protein
MKKFVTIWGVSSMILFISLIVIILNSRYLYDYSSNSITLLEYDNFLSASVILSLTFVGIGYLFLVIALFGNKNRIKEFAIRFFFILPIAPITQGLLFFLFDVFRTEDKYYYFSIGSNFIVNNHELFDNSMTFDEIANIGEHLRFGIASYLLLLLFVLLLINQILFTIVYSNKKKNSAF